MPRDTFDHQLNSLQEAIVRMGGSVDVALDRSIHALVERDPEEAHRVIADDLLTNQAQHDIEERCIVLLATQQPMARDLRVIVAILNIVVELERIGDYAEGIGKIALRLIPEPVLKPLIDIPRMAVVARGMVTDSIRAFMERDATLARSVAEGDDEVDALTDQVYRELLTYMLDDPKTIERATHLMWVSHNLERSADRATNIAERVVQLVTGEIEELNP
ncbi:MAG: phosphate signaling complex protein PhoU [Anaerolineae bacterium]|nr:phosphate signaling complex protein PhoU [Anaerolineae bacterium]